VLRCFFGLLKHNKIFVILIIAVCFVTFRLCTFRYWKRNSMQENGN
jgi:cytochrome b subunit of formate dehydrogenase